MTSYDWYSQNIEITAFFTNRTSNLLFIYLYKCSIAHTHTHTHTRLTALFPGLPGSAGTRNVKPIWISLKQETVSGSGISHYSTHKLFRYLSVNYKFPKCDQYIITFLLKLHYHYQAASDLSKNVHQK